MRCFAGLRMDPLPDETTILKFRRLLEEHDPGEGLKAVIDGHLRLRGCPCGSARWWTRASWRVVVNEEPRREAGFRRKWRTQFFCVKRMSATRKCATAPETGAGKPLIESAKALGTESTTAKPRIGHILAKRSQIGPALRCRGAAAERESAVPERSSQKRAPYLPCRRAHSMRSTTVSRSCHR